MEKVELEDFDEDLPSRLEVAVVMEKRPSSHPWAEFSFDAVGLVVRAGDGSREVKRVLQDGEVEHFLVTGLVIELSETDPTPGPPDAATSAISTDGFSDVFARVRMPASTPSELPLK